MTSPLDSDVIADYLINHPHFFEEHAELLGTVKLSSPLLGRAVSLQERQMEVLRDKIRTHELQMAKLLRTAQDNEVIANNLEAWMYALLRAKDTADLPRYLIDNLVALFQVPQASLRLWNTTAGQDTAWYTQQVSDDVRLFTDSLETPFCGDNRHFEAVAWLPEPSSITSVALIPLRLEGAVQSCGLLVIGSPDAARFTIDMRTDFLNRIGQATCATLGHLLTAPPDTV